MKQMKDLSIAEGEKVHLELKVRYRRRYGLKVDVIESTVMENVLFLFRELLWSRDDTTMPLPRTIILACARFLCDGYKSQLRWHLPTTIL